MRDRHWFVYAGRQNVLRYSNMVSDSLRLNFHLVHGIFNFGSLRGLASAYQRKLDFG